MSKIPAAAASGAGSILADATIAIRYNVIPKAHWYGKSSKPIPSSWLKEVHNVLDDSEKAAEYVRPLASFHSDVTTPFTSRQQLPVTVLVEPITKPGPQAGEPKPTLVEISICPFKTNWEGNDIEVPEGRFVVEFRETLTLFESGHIVYGPSFLIRPSEPVAPIHLIALTSLISTPSAGYGQSHDTLRTAIGFCLAGSAGAGERKDLISFLKERVEVLVAPESTDNVFADLIRPVLLNVGWTEAQRDEARESVSDLEWGNIRSASVEVVGPKRYKDFVQWCDEAADITEADDDQTALDDQEVGDDQLAFAALAQNILDVENQDRSEVMDSLSEAVRLAGEILLIHPEMTFRCTRSNRAFRQMSGIIGGCPYVMVTDVVLAYNEYLLDLSAKRIDEIKQSLRKTGWSNAGGEVELNKLSEVLEARKELFERQILHVLPNIFRYSTERKVFEAVVQQRGLGLRADVIDRFTSSLYELNEDTTDLHERKGTYRTNQLLLALSTLQVCGLFLTALIGYRTLNLAWWAWIPLLAGLVATVIAAMVIGIKAFRAGVRGAG